jgi:O-methyltransferase involved in polyketide biosynthesis
MTEKEMDYEPITGITRTAILTLIARVVASEKENAIFNDWSQMLGHVKGSAGPIITVSVNAARQPRAADPFASLTRGRASKAKRVLLSTSVSIRLCLVGG